MDVLTIRMVIVGLGLVCCVCLGGIIYLAAIGQEPPHSLAAIASSAAGALVGITVTTRNNGSGPDVPVRPTT